MQNRKKKGSKFDTAIHVRVKRYDTTFFIICDEYETVQTLKGRCLDILNQLNFKMKGQEEDLTVDDLRLHLKKRVSYIISVSGDLWFKFLTYFIFCLLDPGR